MKENLIKTIDLENNMQLNFYDESRKLAGDRWLVSLVIHMEIPVSEALLHDEHSSTETVEEVEKVLFEQKRERIFIDEDDKETVFAELNDNFIARTLKYLSRKSFLKKYVMKMYKEAEKKQSLYQSPPE